MAQYMVPSAGSDDNMCEFTIPIDGRPEPITVVVPKLNWMNPKHTKAYAEWFESVAEKAKAWDAWVAEQVKRDENGDPILDDDGNKIQLPEDQWADDAPCAREDVIVDLRAMQLRHLHPFLSAKDFRAVMDNCSAGQAQFIFDRITGKDDSDNEVDPGESSASTDS